MKNFLNYFICFLKSKKIFSIEKKKFVIFDSTNTDVISKILPKNETYIISARVEKIDKILINFQMIFFLISNLFSRSLQLNYFISLINQINPKFVITTVDNSINFSILTKHYENKIKFLALQCATRGGIYENINNHNKFFYFTNYFGFSDFDYKLMKSKNIKIKNFFPIGSLRNSYYKNFLHNQNTVEKKYDICLICKRIFIDDKFFDNEAAEATLKIIRYLAQYVKKKNKSIIIQSKSKKNINEENFYERTFNNTRHVISWKGNINFNSYKNISSSHLIVGVPSSLLREASIYPKTKILCFDFEKKVGKQPFEGINHLDDISNEKIEKKLDFLLELDHDEYEKNLKNQNNILMEKKNTIELFKKFLYKKHKSLI